MQITNSFFTTDLGANIYYKNGATFHYYALPEQAYNGSTLAAAIQTATGRSTSYNPDTNAITQTITTGQEWLSDTELKTYTTGFLTDASPTAPLS